MRIMICGVSGLIGRALYDALQKNHSLTLVGRNLSKLMKQFPNEICCVWSDLTKELVASQDVVINLAGENIGDKRWSKDQKKKIIESRVTTTKLIAKLCASIGEKSPRILNASAIGVYGLPKRESKIVFDEFSPLPNPPTDFLSQVGKQWEDALMPAEAAGVDVVKLRFGVVLSAKGGALKKMLPSFKFGMGAIIGDGKQPLSWVALDDVVLAILFLMNHPEETGAFNIVADEIVSQLLFAKTLAVYLHRPQFMRLTAFVIKSLFGEMGEELLLSGQAVRSIRLSQLGFRFKYTTLPEALAQSI